LGLLPEDNKKTELVYKPRAAGIGPEGTLKNSWKAGHQLPFAKGVDFL
jgi:hypothetical protein